MNHRTEFVALHKDKYVIPIMLTVSKVSGLGEDTMFMGVIEEVPLGPNEAKCWVLWDSTMLSVDLRFNDWFAHKPDVSAGTGAVSFSLAGLCIYQLYTVLRTSSPAT